MKLWLNEILACPEDKHFPLYLYILKWNTEKRKLDFPSIIHDFKAGTLEPDIPKGLVEIKEEPGQPIKIKDMIAIKPMEPKEYIETLLKSIAELDYVFDYSPDAKTNATEIINFIKTEIRDNLQRELANVSTKDSAALKKVIDRLYPAFGLLNIVKIIHEVDVGILYCEKCNRWFPMFDSIPQMLPDKFRVKDSDAEFKEQWFSKIPSEISSKFLNP